MLRVKRVLLARADRVRRNLHCAEARCVPRVGTRQGDGFNAQGDARRARLFRLRDGGSGEVLLRASVLSADVLAEVGRRIRHRHRRVDSRRRDGVLTCLLRRGAARHRRGEEATLGRRCIRRGSRVHADDVVPRRADAEWRHGLRLRGRFGRGLARRREGDGPELFRRTRVQVWRASPVDGDRERGSYQPHAAR